LTSLYIGLKGSYAYRLAYKRRNKSDSYPVRKLYLNLISMAKDGGNKYEFKFKVADEVVQNESEYWFEVGKILDMEPGDVSTYFTDFISNSGKINYTREQAKFATNTLSQLFQVINKSGTLSFYKEKSEELDKVLNIFIRVNSGGTVLTYSDLLLSIASAQWQNYDAREEITEFVDQVNAIGSGFKINKDFVLKTALVLSDFPNIAFKVDNFNKQNMEKIENAWDSIKKSILQAVHLVNYFGYSGETLSSNNALIPIAYYLMIIGLPENFVESRTQSVKDNKQKIKKWLIMSLLKKAFSGQPDNVLRPIRDIIRENGANDFPLEQIINKFKGSDKSIQFNEEDIDEYLLKLNYGSRETLSTLMLLYPSLDFSNKFHEDHMYPKSKFKKKYLKEKGVADDKIGLYIETVNNIANIQLLAAQVNEEKQNTDFDIWFNGQHPNDDDKIQYRTIHMLPNMEYSYGNFLDFIENRRAILREKLKSILL